MTGAVLAPALASGMAVGFSLGLIGGGGSILATPLLLYVVGVSEPHVAIGTGALAVAVNAFVALIGHARVRNVRWLYAGMFAAAGTLGAFAGSSIGKPARSRPTGTAITARSASTHSPPWRWAVTPCPVHTMRSATAPWRIARPRAASSISVWNPPLG